MKFWFNDKKFFIALFILLFIYLLTGFYIIYNHLDIITKAEVFLGADNARAWNDLTVINSDHYRIKVHPLFILLIQPFVHTLNLIINNTAVSLIIIQSVFGVGTCVLIFFILKNFNVSNNISFISMLLWGLSFCALIFSSIPETYIYSAFFNLLLWFYISKLMKNNKLSTGEIINTSLFSALATGIILSNFLICIISIVFLLQNVYENKLVPIIKELFKIILLSILFITILNFLQSLLWKTPILFKSLSVIFTNPNEYEDFKYFNFHINSAVMHSLFYQYFIAPFYAIKIIELPQWGSRFTKIVFKYHQNIMLTLPVILIYCYALISAIKNKIIKNKLIITLFFIILIEFISFIFYGNFEAFIYSPNYLIFIILFFANIFNNCQNKFLYLILSLIFICQIILNFKAILYIVQYLNKYAMPDANYALFPIYSLIIAILFAIIAFFISKKIKKIQIEKVLYIYIFYCLLFLTLQILSNLCKNM